ncbi:MAG: Holliday junction resolvase RuvX [Planctomycetota bacterium]
MRYLAVDLGDRRTGLGVGDDETRVASPVGVVEIPLTQRERLIGAIVHRAAEEEVGALVVGVPLHMDGSASPRAAVSRAFAADLGRAAGLAVHEQDERLTSVRADHQMARTGLTHKQKKRRRDALAAAAILEAFFEHHRGGSAVRSEEAGSSEPHA